jgi:hypothetical protein
VSSGESAGQKRDDSHESYVINHIFACVNDWSPMFTRPNECLGGDVFRTFHLYIRFVCCLIFNNKHLASLPRVVEMLNRSRGGGTGVTEPCWEGAALLPPWFGRASAAAGLGLYSASCPFTFSRA